MEIKLYDSELKVMDVIWKEGDITAKQISVILKDQIGWNKNTTYTLIKRCIEKGAIERIEPNFICHARVKKEQIQEQETVEFVNKIFDGSVDLLFASLLKKQQLSKINIEKLKDIINKLE